MSDDTIRQLIPAPKNMRWRYSGGETVPVIAWALTDEGDIRPVIPQDNGSWAEMVPITVTDGGWLIDQYDHEYGEPPTDFIEMELPAMKDRTDLIPDGTYLVMCKESEVVKTSAGHRAIQLRCSVQSTDVQLVTRIVLTPDDGHGLNRFFEKLTAFGIDDKVLATKPKIDDLAAMFKGRSATAKIETPFHKGQQVNEVVSFTQA